MRIKALEPFGVELVDFTPATASEADLQAFEAAFKEHSLVLIQDPSMTADQHIALIERLGEVATETAGGGRTRHVTHDPSIQGGDNFAKGELVFHFDLVATDDWPYRVLSLYGEEVTTGGGETRFAHGGRAYQKLDDATRQAIAGKRAVHIFDPYGASDSPRVSEDQVGKFAERGVHDVVRPHSYGDGQVLTVARATTDRIVGLSPGDSERLIEAMFDALYRPDAVYNHAWTKGDLLVWDNRVVQHARTPFDLSQRRSLRRVVVADSQSLQTRYRRWAEQVPVG